MQFGSSALRTSAVGATGVTAANLDKLTARTVTVPGIVDATALYLHQARVKGGLHDTAFVLTAYGKTVAFDVNSGDVLWTYTPPNFDSWNGTRQITNATPILDPDRSYLYTTSPDGYIEKLAVADGHELWRTAITLLPPREKMDSPLSYAHGEVIAVTAGYIGDRPPYQGHVAELNAATGKLDHVWNSLCSDRSGLIEPSSCASSDSAIWGRAGLVIEPVTGDLLFSTGNAPWNGSTDWGDAVLELNPEATALVGNWTPNNTAQLNDDDLDIGSTSPAWLGGGLIAQGGKDGQIRLLSLAQIKGAEPHKDHELYTVFTPSGTDLFTAIAVAHLGGKTWMFAADNGGTAAWTVENNQFVHQWTNKTPGTSPLLAGGLLFVYDQRDGGLKVYEPSSGRLLTTLACGTGHWNSPIVVDGKIILPVGNADDLLGFRRRGASGPALDAKTATGTVMVWSLPR